MQKSAKYKNDSNASLKDASALKKADLFYQN